MMNRLCRLLLILLIVLSLYHLFNRKLVERFESDIPKVAFPFKNMYDDQDREIPILCIGAPFRNDTHKKLYEQYKSQGYPFIGSSSYQEFPGKIVNPHEDTYHTKHNDNYEKMVRTWIHCFRNPEKYLKTNIPKALISESDFVDPGNLVPDQSVKKKYDFMYVCLDEGAKHESTACKPGWQAHNRNWELAKECLKVMCGDFHLKGLIMGRTNCDITEKCNTYITSMPFQPQKKFLQLIQECKFIFVPNISDASPRVVTQAMCYNLPVLMNRNIVGGWKYIDPQYTGVFFQDETDITQALYTLLNSFSNYQPRQWFMKNYGKKNAGSRFLQFLKTHYPEVDFKSTKYITFKRL